MYKKKLAHTIWRTTNELLAAKEQEEILQKRIHLRRLPGHVDSLIDKTLDYIKPAILNTGIDNDQRAAIASRFSKNITQFKFEHMASSLYAWQLGIQGHERSLKELQVKLHGTCNERMIEAVERRQHSMRERHDIYLRYKLETFFDDAPTTTNE